MRTSYRSSHATKPATSVHCSGPCLHSSDDKCADAMEFYSPNRHSEYLLLQIGADERYQRHGQSRLGRHELGTDDFAAVGSELRRVIRPHLENVHVVPAILPPLEHSAHEGKVRTPDHKAKLFAVSYTHLRAHETGRNLVCRLLLEKKK